LLRSKPLPVHAFAAAVLLASSGPLLTGCASTRVDAQWSDAEFAGRSLRGTKIFVVCDANETVIKRICEEKMAAQVAASGATPVVDPGSVEAMAAPGTISEKTLAGARGAGATAVLASIVAPDAAFVNPGPAVGFGIGGFGGSGGWARGGGVGGGIGISLPVGGAQVSTAYAASMVLADVATGRLIWTSKVTAPASQNINAQIGELAKVGIEAVQKAGLL